MQVNLEASPSCSHKPRLHRSSVAGARHVSMHPALPLPLPLAVRPSPSDGVLALPGDWLPPSEGEEDGVLLCPTPVLLAPADARRHGSE